jgi:hypothetical protein
MAKGGEEASGPGPVLLRRLSPGVGGFGRVMAGLQPSNFFTNSQPGLQGAKDLRSLSLSLIPFPALKALSLDLGPLLQIADS